MLIRVKHGELFGFAGLWDTWKKPDGTMLESFTIATTPNEIMRGIHDRMPVIIQRKEPLGSTRHRNHVLPLLALYPSELMEAYPVSPLVNLPANDGKECAERDAGTSF